MIPCQCECGHNVHTPIAIVLKCAKCGKQIKCDGVERPKKPEPKPKKPKSEVWVRLVRMIRIPSDIGIGDTLQRQFAKFGGERFKRWAAKLGIPCGCTERQNHYNKKYPY